MYSPTLALRVRELVRLKVSAIDWLKHGTWPVDRPALRGLRLRPCACGAARGAGGARLAAGQAASRTGERLGGGFRWRGVGDRVDAPASC